MQIPEPLPSGDSREWMSSPGEEGASGEIRETNLGELLHYKYLLGLAMSEALQGELTYGKVQTNKTEIWSWKGGKARFCTGKVSKLKQPWGGRSLGMRRENKARPGTNKERGGQVSMTGRFIQNLRCSLGLTKR